MDAKQVMKYLKQLPHEQYVLHGSPHLTHILEPRQAECLAPDGTKDEEKSQVGVYASIWVRDAVVCAVVHNKPTWKVSNDLRTLTVLGDDISLGPGYLYVLPQTRFKRLSNVFWFVSSEPVRPIRTLPVSPDILKFLPEIVLPPHLKSA